MQRSAFLACGALLLVTAACGPAREPAVEACAGILARRLPESRVVEAVSDGAAQVALDFEIGGGWWEHPEHGSLDCSFAEQPNGGLRLQDATLNGVTFSDNERTVINVELLLADMRRSADGTAARRE